AYAAWMSAREEFGSDQLYYVTGWVWHAYLGTRPPSLGGNVMRESPAGQTPEGLAVNRRHCDLIRCVFGNPFRRVALAPAWRTADVVRLAEAAYQERDAASGELEAQRLLVLSDAVEEASCSDAGLLGHLRAAGPHVRGCWALDLLREEEPAPPLLPKK